MSRIYNNNNQLAIAQLSAAIAILQTQIDSSISGYKSTITNSDITLGVYTATHNLGTIGTSVTVFDNTGEQIFPGEITVIDANAIAIDLSAYTPINGTYTVLIYG